MAERIKYKQLLKKKCKREYGDDADVVGKNSGEKETLVKTDITEENEASNPKWQDTDHIIRKIDYDNLERSLFITQIGDYHDLISHVNIWAISLGFLVKLKRPPKVN